MARSLLPLLVLLAGCVPKPPIEDQAQLSSACEVRKCRCAGERASIFSDAPIAAVRWRTTGAAYCDSGFHLERVVEEKRPGY
jgi:hypothetical protein